MSELRPNRAAPTTSARPAPGGRADPLGPVRPSTFTPGAAASLAAARDALRDAPFSREALRSAVVRYGAMAADAGAHASELTAPLEAALAPALARFPAAVAAELRVHVAWWAAHGYHRAD